MIAEQFTVKLIMFAFAGVVSWCPGSWLLEIVWLILAPRRKPNGQISISVPTHAATLGGLERILFIFSVMVHRYEILTGWLVMKAFFGWIPRETAALAEPSHNKSEVEESEIVLRRYNVFLIGNLLSLFLGLFMGNVANTVAYAVIRHSEELKSLIAQVAARIS